MVLRHRKVSLWHRKSRLPVHAYCGNSPPTIPAVHISRCRRKLPAAERSRLKPSAESATGDFQPINNAAGTFSHELDASLERRLHELIQIPVEHGGGVPHLHAGTQILDARLIEDVGADLF